MTVKTGSLRRRLAKAEEGVRQCEEACQALPDERARVFGRLLENPYFQGIPEFQHALREFEAVSVAAANRGVLPPDGFLPHDDQSQRVLLWHFAEPLNRQLEAFSSRLLRIIVNCAKDEGDKTDSDPGRLLGRPAIPPEVMQVYLDNPEAIPSDECEDCGLEVPVGLVGAEHKVSHAYFQTCPLCGGRTGRCRFQCKQNLTSCRS